MSNDAGDGRADRARPIAGQQVEAIDDVPRQPSRDTDQAALAEAVLICYLRSRSTGGCHGEALYIGRIQPRKREDHMARDEQKIDYTGMARIIISPAQLEVLKVGLERHWQQMTIPDRCAVELMIEQGGRTDDVNALYLGYAMAVLLRAQGHEVVV